MSPFEYFCNFEHFLIAVIDRMPIDTSAPHGYCEVLIFQILVSLVYFVVLLTVASMFFGWGLFFDAFRAQFELDFRNMPDLVSREAAPRSTIKLKELLIEAIKFHVEVRE